ncbi:hypothetical protein EDC14_1004166 [Hydrogenispora ethanolica]|jgi:hypothetical protein|uniref:Uncharacterized protein n=1 Tax=Hydrogenispora ethanolica TaxID=1082276 RepID=A0A4R1S4S7_HYDET|nr:hypothetical protein [Hydrogenispora ethanolica]TCL74228.1 hypothetical protein EDC14_1004166 [Hydrogenispora ethanolica]
MPKINRSRYRKQLERSLSQYSSELSVQTRNLAEFVLEKLQAGATTEKAINLSIKETGFFHANMEATVAAIYRAAAAGYGILPTMVANPEGVKRTILNEPWTPDDIPLSSRLHGAHQQMKQDIIDSVNVSLKQQKTLTEMSRKLYEGYGYGPDVSGQADLPGYLSKLRHAAQRVAAGDKAALREYQTALANAESRIAKLARRGAPTKAMKAAYSEMVDAAKTLNEKALERATRTAIEERSRYYAERIARTESMRAYYEETMAQYRDDDDVIAVRWVLSSRHALLPFDICDLYANANLYGLGKGVYPKDKVPAIPVHPHCMCTLEPVYVGEIEPERLKNIKFSGKAVDEFLTSLTLEKQKALLGTAGQKAWAKGKGWKEYLHSWKSPDAPIYRFESKDFNNKEKQAKGEKWYNQDVKLVYDNIVKHEPQITKNIRSIISAAGGQMRGLEFRLKTEESFMRKVKADYEADQKKNSKVTYTQVALGTNDVIRYTAVADENSFYDLYQDVMGKLKAEGYELVKVKNTWNDDSNPYKGVNAILRSPGGQNFELQFHTPDSFDMKQNNLHVYYEEYRSDSTSAERKAELLRLMFKLSRELKKPKWIEKL